MDDQQIDDVLDNNLEASHQPQDAVQNETHEETPVQQESKQDRNWKEVRRKLEYYEQKIAELESKNSPIQADPVQEEEDVQVADDDYVTAKDVKKLAKKMAREMVMQEKQKLEAETAEERLRSKFADFEDIVSEENVKKLIKQEPELAKVLRATADPYAKGVAAYRYIQLMERANPAAVDKQVVRQNLSKPKSTSSIRDSGLDFADEFGSGRLSEEMKRKLAEEMRDAARRR